MAEPVSTSSESEGGGNDTMRSRVTFDANSKPPEPSPTDLFRQHPSWADNTHSLVDRDVDEFNEMMLYRATRDAGLWAFGVIAVEVWIHSERENFLYMPKGGYWRDPVFQGGEALSQLEDSSRSDYVPPGKVAPMVGLPGVLWTEIASKPTVRRPTVGGNRLRLKSGKSGMFTSKNLKSTKFRSEESEKNINDTTDDLENNMKGTRSGFKTSTKAITAPSSRGGRGSVQSSSRFRSSIETVMFRRGRRSTVVSSGAPGNGRDERSEPSDYRSFKVVWRHIPALVLDPDQPPDPRTKLLSDAGFGLAAGVRFDIRGYRGLVIYLARATVNTDRLQCYMNERYMRNAAYLIAAESALSKSRKVSIEARAEERRVLKKRLEKKLHLFASAHKEGTPLEEVKEGASSAALSGESPVEDKGGEVDRPLMNKLSIWAKKTKGLNVNPPPRMPPAQIAWTFSGIFITEAILLNLYFYLMKISNQSLGIPTGILSAISVMHFGLTAAPATQPRNFIYGEVVGCLVPIIGLYIFGKPGPGGILSPWFQGALATSVTGAIQVGLGVTHPPAAASALIFTLNDLRWGSMGVMLLYSAISVLISVIINNMSLKRQYPVYWAMGFDQIPKLFQCCMEEKLKEEEEEQKT